MGVGTLPRVQHEEIHGVVVGRLPDDGPALVADEQLADLIGTAAFAGVDLLAIPVGRLDPRFFDLATRRAGELVQKAATYRVRLAVVGDVAAAVAASAAFAAFVRECDRGSAVWFVADDAALAGRLAAATAG